MFFNIILDYFSEKFSFIHSIIFSLLMNIYQYPVSVYYQIKYSLSF